MSHSEKVLKTMIEAGKPLRTSEICELSELAKKDVDKAMKELKASDSIISPKRCFWEAK